MNININVDKDNETDLLDLEQLAYLDNAYTILMDININIDGDDEVDLVQIVEEKNIYLSKYYFN